jgi:hypothetical protein
MLTGSLINLLEVALRFTCKRSRGLRASSPNSYMRAGSLTLAGAFFYSKLF